MDNNGNQAAKPKEKAKGKKKDESLNRRIGKAIVNRWHEFKGEFKKIIWPDRKALVKHTVNVSIISLLVGAVIVVFDFLFSNGYSLFVKLFQ